MPSEHFIWSLNNKRGEQTSDVADLCLLNMKFYQRKTEAKRSSGFDLMR